jgi:hypothetical protein
LTDKKLLTYYCTLYNHEIKRRLYCLSLKTSSNEDVKVLNAQVQLITVILHVGDFTLCNFYKCNLD